jgi:hypothetical protein
LAKPASSHVRAARVSGPVNGEREAFQALTESTRVAFSALSQEKIGEASMLA